MVLSEWTRLSLESGGAIDKYYFEHVYDTVIDMFDIFNGTFWLQWRTQITYQLVKLFFALTAAPFFLFTIGPLAKIFAHADPTAWTRGGRCVQPQPTGLAAYLSFLKNDVLNSSTFAAEFQDRFSQREVKQLTRAVVEGERLLASAWARPARFTRDTIKEKLRIDAILAKIVTKEKASPALYQKCFPDRMIVDDYIAAQEAEELRAKEMESKKVARGRKATASGSK